MRILTRLMVFSLFCSLLSPVRAEEVVEGVAAVLTLKKRTPIREIIFVSDIERYRLFFEPPSKKSGPAERLDAVIHQRLLRPEARRFILDPPTPEAIEAQLRIIRGRFENEDAFENALLRTGMTLDELKSEIKEDLWVKALLEERIEDFIFISPRAIENYYLEHAERFEGKKLESVEQEIENLLTAEKEALKKQEYLQRLKNDAEIKILYDPQRKNAARF